MRISAAERLFLNNNLYSSHSKQTTFLRCIVTNTLAMEGVTSHSNDPNLKFIDIGANLTDLFYKGIYYGKQKHSADLKEVIDRAKVNGVDKILITSGCLEDIHVALDICRKYDKDGIFLYTTAGVHPTNCNEFIRNKFNKNAEQYIESLDEIITLNKDRIVAIGELGLDYDRLNYCEKDTQMRYFELQLQLAGKHKLPLFLHMRNATCDTLDILRRNREMWREGGGVCHSFTGDIAALKELLNDGFYIGINGCSLKTQLNLDTVKCIPLNRILLETDCPWCGIKATHASSCFVKTKFETIKRPEKMNGKCLLAQRNEPCQILQVSEVVYALQNEEKDYKTFTTRIYNNTLELFKSIAH